MSPPEYEADFHTVFNFLYFYVLVVFNAMGAEQDCLIGAKKV